MRSPGASHRQLMDESEAHIAAIARDGPSAQAQLARRMLDDTRLYSRWEAEHDRLMRSVAEARERQPIALRRASFGLIHRKATFEYLQQQRIKGRDRHAVFRLLFGENHDYVCSVIQEHGNYLRATASFLCTSHIGLRLYADDAFEEAFRRYEQLYGDYFRTFCTNALAADPYQGAATLRTLLPYLKEQLGKLRRAILALPHDPRPCLRPIEAGTEAANGYHRPFRAA